MASVNYDDIYSRFFTKVEAYDFLNEEVAEETLEELMCSWLHSSLAYPAIRKTLKEIAADDTVRELTYEFSYTVDDFSDEEFLKELLAYGMLYFWIQPKVNSLTNIYQFFGTSDTKYFSQQSHLSELRALRDDAENKIRSLIRDRGFYDNLYLDGKSASTTLRRQNDI